MMDFSHNLIDLNLDIGMYIQLLQSGEESDDNLIENLEKIQTSILKIRTRLSGGIEE